MRSVARMREIDLPEGACVCWNCDGTGEEENLYAHDCSGPVCQDPAVIECHLCDGRGYVPAGQRAV
ncbi:MULTISPECIES: hypothetical protein [unclassified Streptomyces]|uniref:hypothetical protein n=1 Tax=unclassified Streptomyces TaxID=2593676 RepID=UPI00344E3E6B